MLQGNIALFKPPEKKPSSQSLNVKFCVLLLPGKVLPPVRLTKLHDFYTLPLMLKLCFLQCF